MMNFLQKQDGASKNKILETDNIKETLKRQNIIIAEVLKHDNKRVLNIGDVRDGFITTELKGLGYQVTTIDVFENADYIMDFDGKNFPVELYGKFDIVVAGEIIEHCVYTDKFLEQIKKCLVPYGIIVMSFPNIACLKNRIKLLFGKFPTYGAAPIYGTNKNEIDKYHVRDFNLEQMKFFLKRHDLRIMKARTNGIYVRDKVIIPSKICPTTFGNQIILTVLKDDN